MCRATGELASPTWRVIWEYLPVLQGFAVGWFSFPSAWTDNVCAHGWLPHGRTAVEMRIDR